MTISVWGDRLPIARHQCRRSFSLHSTIFWRTSSEHDPARIDGNGCGRRAPASGRRPAGGVIIKRANNGRGNHVRVHGSPSIRSGRALPQKVRSASIDQFRWHRRVVRESPVGFSNASRGESRTFSNCAGNCDSSSVNAAWRQLLIQGLR